MEWFNLVCDLLVPLIMIGLGWSFMKKPPKNINSLYGYRTSMSMKNQDTWEFAHRICGRVWCVVGCAMLPLAVLAWTRTRSYSVDEAAVWNDGIEALEAVALLVTIIPVEWALKRNFDKNGVRRQA